MVTRRVVVTGLGCVTPVGNDVPTAWRNICAGQSGVGYITAFDASTFKTRIAAEVKGFDPAAVLGRKESRRMDRYTQFAVAASLEALAAARLSIPVSSPERTGVLVGTGMGGIGTLMSEMEVLRKNGPNRISPFLVPMLLADNAGGQVAIHTGARGPNHCIVSACASGTNAIGEAAEVIRRGAADVMIAGGAESTITPIGVAGFGVMGALSEQNDPPSAASRPFDKNRSGFIIGEGAGIIVLEELEYARSRKAPILAELAGYGTTDDAHHISAPLEDGSGAAMCMRLALAQAGIDPAAVDYINAHGTGTVLNDKGETRAIKDTFGAAARAVAVSSTKSMTGHLLGAAGGLEAAISVLAIRDGMIPPTINYETPDPDCDLDYTPNQLRRKTVRIVMSNSFGFGGHNAAVIFRRLPEGSE
ncbi:MAG: beta-ketoacyl-ACP synthase II [Anaerolineales bacterium]|nr:beta-ketoacyl-ACP synthase II [Anaerolineales bacterium]